jgi:hypothetical protein
MRGGIQVAVGVRRLPVNGVAEGAVRPSYDQAVKERQLAVLFSLHRELDVRVDTVEVLEELVEALTAFTAKSLYSQSSTLFATVSHLRSYYKLFHSYIQTFPVSSLDPRIIQSVLFKNILFRLER